MSLPPTPLPPDLPPDAAAAPAQQLSYAVPRVEGVVLTPKAYEMLRQTRPWVLFVGIVLIVIGALALVGSAVGVAIGFTRQPEMVGVSIAYVVVGLLYLFPGIYLRRYAAGIRDLMKLGGSEHLEAALEAQKAFWRLIGILTALILGLYVVILLFAVAGLGIARFLR